MATNASNVPPSTGWPNPARISDDSSERRSPSAIVKLIDPLPFVEDWETEQPAEPEEGPGDGDVQAILPPGQVSRVCSTVRLRRTCPNQSSCLPPHHEQA